MAGHLGVAADEYDRTIRTFIPELRADGRDDRPLARRARPGRTACVVDLGAGTGGLAAAILDALPDVRVQLVDVDPNMLEVAAARCAAHADRVELRHARFEDPLPRCHAVVASLALHHVAHARREARALPRRSSTALEPGGLVVVGDFLVHPDGPGAARGCCEDWYAHMERNGISRRGGRGALRRSGRRRTS